MTSSKWFLLAKLSMVVALCPARAVAIPVTPEGGHASAPTGGERLSLEVHEAPLEQVVALIEESSQVRFRYGAPPDAAISCRLHNAEFWPSLKHLMAGEGFHLRRDKSSHSPITGAGGEVFLFRDRQSRTAPIVRKPITSEAAAAPALSPVRMRPAVAMPLTWQFWNGRGLPSLEWKLPQRAAREAVGKNRTTGAGGSYWQWVEMTIQGSRSPGIVARESGTYTSEGSEAGPHRTSFWRWLQPLRRVPRSATLLLQTDSKLTLYVNGARLVHQRQGRMELELSQVLRRGANCIALVLEPPPAALVSSEQRGAGDTVNEKLEAKKGDTEGASVSVHYEWFFSGEFTS